MIDWLILLAAVLATYRVSHMIVSEDGPFYILARLRRLAHRTVDGPRQWVYEGLTCVLCVSFWLSWVTAVLLWAGGWTALPLWLSALAIGGAVLFLHKFLYG